MIMQRRDFSADEEVISLRQDALNGFSHPADLLGGNAGACRFRPLVFSNYILVSSRFARLLNQIPPLFSAPS